jgi:hemolysin activation/secretion protein
MLALVALQLSVGIAHAQDVRIPSAAEPGRELQQAPKLEPTPAPYSITVPEAPAIEAPPGADKFSFELKHVSVEGSTLLSPDQLAAYYQPLLDTRVTVADLFKVAAEIENFYRSGGYVTSRAIIPQQEIKDGTFRIVIVEGFISDIVIADDIGPATAMVKALLQSLTEEVPVSVSQIERRLLLANDLPGVSVKGSLEPSKTVRGASTLVVKAERNPFEGLVAYDNRNSPYTAADEVFTSATVNSFGPNGDKINLQAKTTIPFDRERLVAGSYQANIGDDGAIWGVNGYFSQSHPGLLLSSEDVHDRVLSLAATTAYPIIRSRLDNLKIDGEFEYRDVVSKTDGKPFNNDRLRILTGGINYDHTDAWDGITAYRVAYSQGLPIFNATNSNAKDLQSRIGASGTFGLWTGQITRVQNLPANFSLFLTATGQYADQPLLASEELALGGANFGRGYDLGEITGIKGIAASQELRYAVEWPELFPNGLQLYQFYDIGRVYRSRDGEASESLASAGGGVRANLLENLYVYVEVADPLTRLVGSQGDKSPRAFFGVTTRF